MKEANNKQELQCFLGMVACLYKFLPKMSSITDSMRQLLGKIRYLYVEKIKK